MAVSIAEWQQQRKSRANMFIGCSSVQTVDSMSPFCIGLSPAMWTVKPQDLIESTTPLFANRTCLCYVNITLTDKRRRPFPPNRASILETLVKNGISPCGQVSPTAYWHNLRNSVFVVSPEGNGVDCHRTYEALIAGCIPIVEQAHKSHLRFVYGDVPMLFTRDYSEITHEYLQKQLEMFNAKTNWDYSRLFMSSIDNEHDRATALLRSQWWDSWTRHGVCEPPNMRTYIKGCETFRHIHSRNVHTCVTTLPS